ncbi:MAG: hypothetical protein QGH83_06565 [Candidatus Pacebacteria bacterium]|jgi:hypothetical protein|nr:hypothetical protein [Candidatus Paceibacterota bacterium]|tara:strand:+ start:842 stop:1243 length:402 start_codon:yes stop_codon:yes gene_type:complete
MAEDFDISSDEDLDLNFDFGFTTVDEDEVQEFETAVQEKVAKAVGQESGVLEDKIDKLLKLREDDSSYQVLFEKRKAELDDIYKSQMRKLEKLILPLLHNLMKNPENEYIKWPGRTAIVQKQINKIVAITRGG